MEPQTIYLVMRDDRDHWGVRDIVGWTDDKAEAEERALALSKVAYTNDFANAPLGGYTMLPFEEITYRAYFVEEASRLNSECHEEEQCLS